MEICLDIRLGSKLFFVRPGPDGKAGDPPPLCQTVVDVETHRYKWSKNDQMPNQSQLASNAMSDGDIRIRA